MEPQWRALPRVAHLESAILGFLLKHLGRAAGGCHGGRPCLARILFGRPHLESMSYWGFLLQRLLGRATRGILESDMDTLRTGGGKA